MAARPPKQDLPKPGGYGPINWARNIPQRGGFSGAALFAGVFGFMSFGWYMLIIQSRQNRYPCDYVYSVLELFFIAVFSY